MSNYNHYNNHRGNRHHNQNKRYNRYKSYNRYHKSGYTHKHPEHRLRDSLFAVLTCLTTVFFAMLWIGLDIGHQYMIIAGAIFSSVVLLTGVWYLISKLNKYNSYR